jgi:hypothetical protein
VLTTLETSLLKAVAFDPTRVPKELLSPNNGRLREWITSELAKKVFDQIVRLTLSDQRVTLLGIVTSFPTSPSEIELLKNVWLAGRGETQVEISPILEALKVNYLVVQSDVAMENCKHQNRAEPNNVLHNIDTLGSVLAQLSYGNVAENPEPNFDDPEFEVAGSFGDPVIDDFFGTRGNSHGGMLNYAAVLWVAPTKSGKSTMSMTLAARAITQGKEVCYISNELSKGIISNNILDAINSMYAGSRDIDDIKDDIRRQCVIYTQGMRSFEEVERRIYWHRSPITIIDSLDHLGYPVTSDKYYKPEDKHNDRASTLLDISRRYGIMLHIPANSSEGNQKQLRKDITEVTSVMGFGSAHYQNTFDLSFGLSRNTGATDRAIVKRMANRITGHQGEVWDLNYDPVGRCYYGISRRSP